MTLTSDKSEPKVWTDAEFMALPGDARDELVNGELVDMGNSSTNRLLEFKRLPKGLFQGSPDLAVEILSPNKTVEEIHDKIVEYFATQTRLVWVVHPDERYVLVDHAPEPDLLLRVGDRLDGEEVIAGFALPVQDLFLELD